MLESFSEAVGTVGFPVAVSVYLLISFQKTINGLKEVINKNTEMIQRLCDKDKEK